MTPENLPKWRFGFDVGVDLLSGYTLVLVGGHDTNSLDGVRAEIRMKIHTLGSPGPHGAEMSISGWPGTA